MKRAVSALMVSCACALALFCVDGPRRAVGAQAPQEGCPPHECGAVSPLIPMQSTEAVHMGLVWTRNSETPKILFHSRFPEYVPNDVSDPDVVDAAIAAGALTDGLGRNDFNPSLRDVLHPSFRDGSDPTADAFQRLTYGGYLLRQGLSQSVPTRIVANRTMERQLLFDIADPDAFANTGKFHTALLDADDFALNRAAFTEVGFSRGNFYNTYCNARVTLADGRVYVFGGHDMQSNNGLRKVNIFDPETETWVPRRMPCTRENWAADPFGAQLFAVDPTAPFFPGCDQRNIDHTQPPEPSDQKYARWYPSAIALPNHMVLVLGGFDQDASVGPDPDAARKAVEEDQPQTDADFTATRVNQVVPEVYDPATDRNIALENARMAFPLYPQLEVVQTGPRPDQWQVCTMNGVRDYGGEVRPGGTTFGTPGGGQFQEGTTWCLDVLAAMRDPRRDVPGSRHWRLLDTAAEVRPYCCPTASLLEIDDAGRTVSHQWLMISARGPGGISGAIEAIDFAEPRPRWRKVGDMLVPLVTSNAVVLPDGRVLIGQGLNRGLPATGDPALDFERREGLRFQMFDPATGLTAPLTTTTVSRGLHGTATLLPDATVLFAGENREALVRPDDPSFPMTASYGHLPAGDPDQGVPVGQVFFPPYLFDPGGLAPRPVIAGAPEEIVYGRSFDIVVAGDPGQIDSVAILRSDHNTHSLTSGDRYVKLAFSRRGSAAEGELRVVAPRLPAQAVPGIYMLFVVDRDGVPSQGRKILLAR
jgi:hypothetical protein